MSVYRSRASEPERELPCGPPRGGTIERFELQYSLQFDALSSNRRMRLALELPRDTLSGAPAESMCESRLLRGLSNIAYAKSKPTFIPFGAPIARRGHHVSIP